MPFYYYLNTHSFWGGGSSVFKNTSFSTSHPQFLALAVGLPRSHGQNGVQRFSDFGTAPRTLLLTSPHRPLSSHPKLANQSRKLLGQGRLSAELNWEFFGATAFGEQLCIILYRERNLLAVLLMQGQCLLYQTGTFMTDRTLPILYSSPIHTPPEQE